MEKLDWIEVGAKVLIFTEGIAADRGFGAHLVESRIKRVNKTTFTVDDSKEPRFSLDAAEARSGDAWTRTIRKAVPLDSDAAQTARVEEGNRRLRQNARHLVDLWQKHPTTTNRRAAITALERLEGIDS
jgi:hypothetical protein